MQGDVILASLAIDERSPAKTRPAIVIRTGESGEVQVCPVSSKAPTDAPCIPISIDDFFEGGLDLFGESYVMVTRVMTLGSGDVIGKKGRLTQESFAAIAAFVPDPSRSAGARKHTVNRGHRRGS